MRLKFDGRTRKGILGNMSASLTLLMTALVLGCVIMVIVATHQAILNTDKVLQDKLPPMVTIDLDVEAYDNYMMAHGRVPDIDGLSQEIMKEIGSLPYVKYYDFSVVYFLLNSNLEPYGIESEFFEGVRLGSYALFDLKGVQTAEPFDISEGIVEITQGRMFDESELANLGYVAVISEDLARVNNLEVGSTISMRDIAWDMREAEYIDDSFFTEENVFSSRSYDLEIIGFFSLQNVIDFGDEWINEVNYIGFQNRIYVPNVFARDAAIWAVEQEAEMNPVFFGDVYLESLINYLNVYVLHDVRDIPAFIQAAESKIPEFYVAVDASGKAGIVSQPLRSLENLAQIVLVATSVIGVFVLSAIIASFAKRRKREIGILLTLGEDRTRIAVQLIMKILPAVLTAFILAVPVGYVLANTFSPAILEVKLEAAQESDYVMEPATSLALRGVVIDVSDADILEAYNVSFSRGTIISFAALNSLLILVATAIPVFYVKSLNLKQVMTAKRRYLR